METLGGSHVAMYDAGSRSGRLRAVRPVSRRLAACAFGRNGTLFAMVPDGTDMRQVKGLMPDGAIAWDPVT